MIITLKGADFSQSNIGTLSSWRITRSLGAGATYEGPLSVDKGAAFSATVTLAEGYELGTAGVTITMGGTVLSGAHSISGNVITITIANVTGNVLIKVPTVNTAGGDEPDTPVEPDTPTEDTVIILGEDLITYSPGGISAAGEWHSTSNTTYALTDVTEFRGGIAKMTGGSNNLVYCFLTAGKPSSGKVVSYATGYIAPVVLEGANRVAEVYIPDNAVYLYNYIATGNTIYRPASIELSKGNLNITRKSIQLDINDMPRYTGGLKSSGEWHNTSGANCVLYDISEHAGKSIEFVKGNKDLIYSFLVDTNNMTVNKKPTYASGYTVPIVTSSPTVTTIIPEDAVYLYMYVNSATVDYTASSVEIYWYE